MRSCKPTFTKALKFSWILLCFFKVLLSRLSYVLHLTCLKIVWWVVLRFYKDCTSHARDTWNSIQVKLRASRNTISLLDFFCPSYTKVFKKEVFLLWQILVYPKSIGDDDKCAAVLLDKKTCYCVIILNSSLIHSTDFKTLWVTMRWCWRCPR